MGNWFTKGNDGVKRAKQKQEQLEQMRKNRVSRFWLKAGESAKVIFVDSEGFYCDVHQFKIRDSWNNFATCVNSVKPCPLCESGLYPTWTAHYTIIDTRKFEGKDGKEYKNIKKLFPAKGEVIQILADLIEEYGSLRGRVFEIKRYGAKEPNTGTHFKYVGKVKDLKKYGEDADKPFDYMEILAPPTKEDYERWGFAVTEELGSDDDIIEDGLDDEEFEDDELGNLTDEEELEEELEELDDELEEELEEIEEKENKSKKKPTSKKHYKKKKDKDEDLIENTDDDILF